MIMIALRKSTRRPLPMPPEELLEAGVLLYMQSVGLAGGIPEHKPS